jgi:hypothetical protein
MLKYEVTAEADIPENLKEFYANEDGVFRLKVDGVVPKTKLDEFRNENISLKKKIEELDGMEMVADAKTGKKTRETIDELVMKRTDTMRSTFETTKKELEDKLNRKQKRLQDLLISDAVKAAAISAGVVDTAIDDVISRVSRAFTVNDEDNVVAVDGALDSNGTPYTINSYVTELKAKKAPHLFKTSTGIGVPGRTRGSASHQPEKSRQERLAAFVTKKN